MADPDVEYGATLKPHGSAGASIMLSNDKTIAKNGVKNNDTLQVINATKADFEADMYAPRGITAFI